MELCDKRNLFNYIYSDDYIPNKQQILKYMDQIFTAVKEIHSNYIIHRDLKLSNILISNGNIKISDFGLSKFAFSQSKCISSNQYGTIFYFSPQMIQNLKYSNKTDIWSIGVICYEIANKRYPFGDYKNIDSNISQRIMNGNYFPFNSNISEDIVNIIKSMIIVDEKERPDINTLISDLQKISKIKDKENKKEKEIIKEINIKTETNDIITKTYPNIKILKMDLIKTKEIILEGKKENLNGNEFFNKIYQFKNVSISNINIFYYNINQKILENNNIQYLSFTNIKEIDLIFVHNLISIKELFFENIHKINNFELIYTSKIKKVYLYLDFINNEILKELGKHKIQLMNKIKLKYKDDFKFQIGEFKIINLLEN
jgi:serine/threonine protein kinase